jgi:hypothetical protein
MDQIDQSVIAARRRNSLVMAFGGTSSGTEPPVDAQDDSAEQRKLARPVSASYARMRKLRRTCLTAARGAANGTAQMLRSESPGPAH